MANFESFAVLVWTGELPKLRDSYTDFQGWPIMTSFVTQDDLVHTFYSFYRISETKLVPKHVSFVKNMTFQNWPLVTSPWLWLCNFAQNLSDTLLWTLWLISARKITQKTCIAWPHCGTKIWWPLVTWPLPDRAIWPAQWYHRTLMCSIKGLLWTMQPTTCFAWSL